MRIDSTYTSLRTALHCIIFLLFSLNVGFVKSSFYQIWVLYQINRIFFLAQFKFQWPSTCKDLKEGLPLPVAEAFNFSKYKSYILTSVKTSVAFLEATCQTIGFSETPNQHGIKRKEAVREQKKNDETSFEGRTTCRCGFDQCKFFCTEKELSYTRLVEPRPLKCHFATKAVSEWKWNTKKNKQ